MNRILQPIRIVFVFAIMISYILHTSVAWIFIRKRWARVRFSNRLLQSYSGAACLALNVRSRAVGLENISGIQNALFVGNHLSYIDVLVISSVKASCFVTSVEVRDTPFIGRLCKMAGSLFVERRSRAKLLDEVGELAEGLQNGVNAAIFPEATSTNGEKILRFKRPLFKAAISAGVPVVPFCLNYHTIGGQPTNRKTADWVMYYGDMSFGSHLWSLAQSGGIDVDVVFLKPRTTEGLSDPTEIAAESQKDVESVFRPVPH